ncbi:hypothetical protein PRIPAC_97000 [Pristionchus pacificus]|uniref:Uncharacterized protein n=1 Tax=Pristionchus pacificus TaxID=54126 RepID=A0A2A6D2V6_PRIPA|nr:hypothetical protein PRIPAC_97000 [Pristionchus pacificus]|eukprot:PDM84774.1 hypothetical protein PRIPAC_33797 [Pristionchus pacificus]
MITNVPLLIENFRAARDTLRANPTLLDESIAKLSTATQEPAKKFRDLMLSSEEDVAKIYDASQAIMEDLPGKVIEELEAYKMEVARIFGLTEDSF